jgi:hypothetical protein
VSPINEVKRRLLMAEKKHPVAARNSADSNSRPRQLTIDITTNRLRLI